MSTITNRIDAITFQAKTLSDKRTAYDSSSRKLTWSILSETYALGLLAFDPANARDFAQELLSRDVKAAKEGANPWLQVLNVAVGEFYTNTKEKRAWKPNASFSKYARALRYMESQNVTSDAALAYIKSDRTYADAKGNRGKHLIGMIEADKIVNPAVRRDMTDKKAMDKALASEPLGEIAIPGTEEWMPRYARAYGELRDGKFIVRGVIEDSEDAAKLDINKMGKALIAKEAS